MHRLLPLALVACATPDLPAGWEDALPVELLVQSDCDGNPYEGDHEATVEANFDGPPYGVSVREATFRCAQDLSAYWRLDAGVLAVLVQPTDMDPAAIAGCDCLYDVETRVDPELEGAVTHAEVWLRGDHQSGMDVPTKVDRVAAE